jgi:hypothetical protein
LQAHLYFLSLAVGQAFPLKLFPEKKKQWLILDAEDSEEDSDVEIVEDVDAVESAVTVETVETVDAVVAVVPAVVTRRVARRKAGSP